jgi:uncharacterized protein (TIGR02217 family)
MAIPDYRLPINLEKGSGFGPSFKNVIQEAISGNEQRFAQWTQCRGVGDLSYAILESDDPLGDYRAVLAMFRAHYGKLLPFRFRDWSDYTATDELFGIGDGVETDFQLTMTYDPSAILLGTPGTVLYVRDISLVVGTPTIEVEGTPLVGSPAPFTISSSGLVSFTSPPTGELTWTGTFDVPVRFDTDQLPVIMKEQNLASIRSIPIKEVIGES